MQITIKGVVAEIGEEKRFASGYAKRELVILEGGSVERPLPVTVSDRRFDQLSGIRVGADVEISAILSAHRWNERLFLSIGAMKITSVNQPAPAAPVAPAPAVPPHPGDSEIQNLPF